MCRLRVITVDLHRQTHEKRHRADVAELVYAADLKSAAFLGLRVRFPSSAPLIIWSKSRIVCRSQAHEILPAGCFSTLDWPTEISRISRLTVPVRIVLPFSAPK